MKILKKFAQNLENTCRKPRTAQKMVGVMICIGVLLVLFSGNVNAAIWSNNSLHGSYNCYQETSNISTVCGGLSTGNYLITTITDPYYDQGNVGVVYINYSKPISSRNDSLWQVKYAQSTNVVNFSIPNSCWDYNLNILSFRLISVRGGTWTYSHGDCLNSTGWAIIFNAAASTGGGGSNSGNGLNIIDGNWETASRYQGGWVDGTIGDGFGEAVAQLWEEAITWKILNFSLNLSISNTIENLSFVGSSDVTRYLKVPSGVSALSNGFLNLTGYSAGDTSNLVAYYRMDEITETVIDSLGILNGTNTTGITKGIQGIINNSYKYDGETSAAHVILSGGVLNNSNQFTISMWYNWTNGGDAASERLIAGNAAGGFAISLEGGTIYASGGGGASTYGNQIFVPYKNTWTHMVFVFNGTDEIFYFNGTFDNRTTNSSLNPQNAQFWLGSEVTLNRNFAGHIDEVGFWNKSLTIEEIESLYNNGVGSRSIGGEAINLTIGNSISALTITANGTFPVTIRTSNLASIINKYLNATYLIGSNYIIPFIFHSDVTGTLGYSFLQFDNNGFLENSQTFTSSVYETSIERLSINISFDSDRYTSSSANLIYNGTTYSGTSSGSGNERVFYRDLEIPVVNSQQNKSFYWQILLTDSNGQTIFNSTFQNQTVNPSNLSTCSGTTITKAINYTAYDEETGAILSVSLTNLDSTFEWKLNESSTITKNYSATLTNNTFVFCINTNRTFFTDADLFLISTGYNSRAFGFSNEEFTNVTTHQRLYLLNDTLGRNVIIVLKDSGLIPLEDYTIKIYRKLQSTGESILVENDQTDIFGQITAMLVENDVSYKLEFYDASGTLLKTVNRAIVACRATICIQQYIIEDTTDIFSDFDPLSDYEWTFTFDNNTNIFTFVWVDNLDTSSSHRLEVTQFLFNGTTTVCNSTSSSDSGVLTCSVGSQNARYTAQAFRTSGGRERRIDVLSEKIGSLSDILGAEGFILSFILLGTMILLGVFYPPVGIGLYMAGIFVLFLFDAIHISFFTLIAQFFIGVLAIWAWRG